jgi:hypothetical protein
MQLDEVEAGAEETTRHLDTGFETDSEMAVGRPDGDV